MNPLPSRGYWAACDLLKDPQLDSHVHCISSHTQKKSNACSPSHRFPHKQRTGCGVRLARAPPPEQGVPKEIHERGLSGSYFGGGTLMACSARLKKFQHLTYEHHHENLTFPGNMASDIKLALPLVVTELAALSTLL